MKITADTISSISHHLGQKGMNQSQLAERIGVSRSYISKMLRGSGEITNLPDELADRINDVLGTALNPISYQEGDVSQTALELSEMARHDSELAGLLESVRSIAKQAKIKPFIPVVETQQLPKIGAKISAIVKRWEKEKDPHYAKIACETLNFMREYFLKHP